MHQQGVDNLAQRLQQSHIDYDEVDSNMTYGYGGGHTGELDVYAIKNDRMLIFEYKCTNSHDHRKHAMNQLKRARKFFKNQYSHISTFYASEDGLVELIVPPLENKSNK